jgi:Scramblase
MWVNTIPHQETMDRDSTSFKNLISSCQIMKIQGKQRSCLENCLDCETKFELKYYIERNQHFAYSLYGTKWLSSPAIKVKDYHNDLILLEVDRPLHMDKVSPGKCCNYQKATFSDGSSNRHVGRIQENCSCCVPSFNMYDDLNRHVYTIHQPTCCGGVCVNNCPDGNCYDEVPWLVFKNDEPVGKISKESISCLEQPCCETNHAFNVLFPQNATTSEKVALMGTSIFIISSYFVSKPEENDDDESY